MSNLLKNFPAKITESAVYSFSVPEFGLYAITLAARCLSAKQSGKRGGEDLMVEIDSRKFREVPPLAKPQYQDIPPAWNGTQLKGLKKTIIFIMSLNPGEHEITFIPDGAAVIEQKPTIRPTTGLQQMAFNLEDQAENGDRRPWHTFVLVDLPLKTLTAEAAVDWRFPDGDDVKLIVDGKIKKNPLSLLHRNWLWSANPLTNLFNQNRQKKTFEESSDLDIHYLEFWADRTPTLHQVILDLGDVKLKRVPTWIAPNGPGIFTTTRNR